MCRRYPLMPEQVRDMPFADLRLLLEHVEAEPPEV